MLDARVFLVSVPHREYGLNYGERSQTHVGLRVKMLSVSDFNQNQNVPANFNTNSNIKFRANLSSGSLVAP
jgi:hypothetical protein